jgi:CheY-like chemotaxis protein
MNQHRPVTIVMVEDDEGHARLIEKNIRRAGVNNEIVAFENGTEAVQYLFGRDGSGKVSAERALLILLELTTTDDQVEIQRCYDLGCNVYITKPVNYEGFATAIRQLGLFLSVIQVPAAG